MIQGHSGSFVSIILVSVCLVLTHLLSVAALIVIILTTTLRLIILTLPPNSTCFHRPKDVIREVLPSSNESSVLAWVDQSESRIVINRRQDVLNNLMTPRLPTLGANFCLKTPGRRFLFLTIMRDDGFYPSPISLIILLSPISAIFRWELVDIHLDIESTVVTTSEPIIFSSPDYILY